MLLYSGNILFKDLAKFAATFLIQTGILRELHSVSALLSWLEFAAGRRSHTNPLVFFFQ